MTGRASTSRVWEKATLSCDHEVDPSLIVVRGDWYESIICPACKRKRRVKSVFWVPGR